MTLRQGCRYPLWARSLHVHQLRPKMCISSDCHPGHTCPRMHAILEHQFVPTVALANSEDLMPCVPAPRQPQTHWLAGIYTVADGSTRASARHEVPDTARRTGLRMLRLRALHRNAPLAGVHSLLSPSEHGLRCSSSCERVRATALCINTCVRTGLATRHM